MKCQLLLPACYLLLWTLTASVRCEDYKIDLKEVSGGIQLTCKDEKYILKKEEIVNGALSYADKNTGEYTCYGDADGKEVGAKIYVKFRTCDNCIELDVPSIVGIVIGNMAATIVIGVAVYLTASQNRTGPITSHKKSSDRQPIVPHGQSSRASNETYERLKRHKKETYDVLNRN